MRTFLVNGPRGNMIRHEAETMAELKAKLLIGYEVAGEVVDGVQIAPPLPDGLKRYTFMTSLLRDHGPELVAFLREAGFVQSPGPKPLATVPEGHECVLESDGETFTLTELATGRKGRGKDLAQLVDSLRDAAAERADGSSSSGT